PLIRPPPFTPTRSPIRTVAIKSSSCVWRIRGSIYDDGWYDPQSYILFQRSKLAAVEVRQDADNDLPLNGYETLVRKYEFIYETDPARLVFPNVVWPHETGDDGRTLTLASVKEYGTDPALALPATTFTYQDGMHLTHANNGYNGQVEFSYQPWFEQSGEEGVDDAFSDYCIPDGGGGWLDLRGEAGWEGTLFYSGCPGDGAGNVLGETFNDLILKNGFHPGGAYEVQATVYRYEGSPPDAWARAGIKDGAEGSTVYGPTLDITVDVEDNHTVEFRQVVPTTFGQAWPVMHCNGCRFLSWAVHPLVTRYRVVEKRLHDGLANTPPRVFRYRYDEPATNDDIHSDIDPDPDLRYVPQYSQFQGHALTQEIGPDGRVTATWFHQDD
ncbi:MAG: hypothetical protein ACRDIB_18450, partial [Ardenticatenaceae bacterium]